jgi:hypothetical protein
VKHQAFLGLAKVCLLCSLLSIGSIACRGDVRAGGDSKELRMNSDTTSALNTIMGYRVFWGHQSVGGNIIDGLKVLLAESNTSWHMAEIPKDALPAGPAFIHQRIGQNGDPKGKMDAFARSIREMPSKPQLAFMKLCYVDVNRSTDVEDLIAHYANTLGKLKAEYPDVVFAHVTVPLAPEAMGIKDRIKRLAGIELKKERDNLRRGQYNALLRKTFPGDPLFDLDRVESTRPDGTRAQFSLDGQTALALAADYAGDESGHLNAAGEKRAAIELVQFLKAAIAR